MADGGTAQSDELVKAAQNEIAQAMNKAMNNISNNSSKDEPQSDFLKKHLSEASVDENIEYVEPMQDPYNKAITYLENHNILQLFQQLTASIVYTKPDKPLEYMMNEVERMKKERDQEKSEK